jgi:hypothetical protein
VEPDWQKFCYDAPHPRGTSAEVRCCVLHTNAIESHESQVSAFGAEIQAAVKSELELILAAPAFTQSSRCKRFLSHVVQQALTGNADQLKERIIGVRVFDRAYDYDTGEDSIVRVTANEVRKRIGQFYQESKASHPIQIDLPRGSYIPEFKIHPAGHGSKEEAKASLDSLHSELPVSASLSAATPVLVSLGGSERIVAPQAGSGTELPRKSDHRPFWISIIVVFLVLGAGAILFGLMNGRTQADSPELWKAFLQSKGPVLVCLGTHDLPVPAAFAPGTEDVLMRTETIPIDDATVLTSIANSLATRGIPFRLVAAEQASLTDLESQPVILIGAIDNRWTLQLTQDLRYRISVSFPLGNDKPPVASIVDSQQTANAAWKIDFSVPLSAWKNDYAIVARENDATIGVPVLIEAGLGNSGSLAASGAVTSGALKNELKNEPSCREKSNFEAVIATGIIDSRPGPPHILRLACW